MISLNRTVRMVLGGGIVLGLLHSGPALWAHDPITLKGYDGKELAIGSKEPYSPRQTCGECHDYDQITNGYHFQQGRTDAAGKVVMADDFNPKKPWIRSAGMFGKW